MPHGLLAKGRGGFPAALSKRQALFSRARRAAKFHLGSVGYFASTHAFHPPLRAYTFGKPWFIISCATRALVPSLGQAQ